VTTSEYLTVLGKAFRGDYVLHPSLWLLFVGLSALVAQRKARWWLLAVWVAFGLHVFLFPMLADRFFLTHYALVLIAAATRSERLD
jgi:hypothetical protein